ncbi:Acriflavin resistance protein [Olavius sp. associated proteobacterium Delta 1]|nr:Acriflavin resistance protein [Olavius sp. associated proteobacterium Delta 1]
MRTAVAWFADNHVAANLLMFFLLLAGAFTGLNTKIEVFPETDLDIITISTEYSGASPAEVEEAILRRIEEKVAGLAGIDRIDSNARESSGTVTIEVMKDWDVKKLLDDVKSEVDRITTLPDEAEKPEVQALTRRSRVINVAVFGDAQETTIKHLAEKIKDDITNLPGITLAELQGLRKSEVAIEISEETLRRHGLTLRQVAQAVRKGSLDLPAGRIKTSGGEILIRTKGRRYHADDYRDVAVISYADGRKVTLGQIADLKDGFEDVDLNSRFQGKAAAMIQVFRVADQNALKVAETVKQYLAKIRPGLPAGIDVAFYSDRSEILKSRLNLLLKNLAIGLVLVSIMLGLFMNLRLAFWVTLGIPISFMAALLVLPEFDVSINMISLFAFIMVLGIVVDDAIIVGENIYRQQEQGYDSFKAAVEGTLEVGRPVIFAVLTTIVAFWPLTMAAGTMGKIMRNIPIVVMLVLAGSLVESLFILPAHLARSAKKAQQRRSGPAKEKRFARWLRLIIEGPYTSLVKLCVNWRYASMAIGLVLLLLSYGVWQAGWIKFIFFPRVEGNTMRCYVTMPVGTPVERTEQVIRHIDQAAREVIETADSQRSQDAPSLMRYSMRLIGRHVGRGATRGTGGHLAQIWVNLIESENREVSTAALTRRWRKKIGNIPDAESVTFRSEIHGAGNPIEIHLSLDDQNQLVAAADALKIELQGYPGVFDIGDSFLPGKKEMQLKLKPAARSLDLTLDDLARQVRHAFYGAEALRLQRGKDELKVMVRYPASQRNSLGSVEDMRIRTPAGLEVPFSQVAQVNIEQGYASIERAQRLRVIKVTADVEAAVTNANEVRLALTNTALPRLQNLYPGLRYTVEGEGKEQKESLGDVLKGFAIALFGIYALLAIPFKSFSQPIIVMAAIPFGFVGALAGHLILGFNISLLSLFGMVGLAGVVVNDSLVLVYTANRMCRQGDKPYDAVIKAGGVRFRPILLTSLTTFAGLTPMMLERSVQAQFLIPMAISLGFGVLFGTVVTLLLIPCGYMILEDLHKLFGGRRPTLAPDRAS